LLEQELIPDCADDDEKKAVELTRFFANVARVRKSFLSSDIVIVPHHGSETKGSQNFLRYFSCDSDEKPRLFIISSNPFKGQGLPKASMFNMAPKRPRLFKHLILYRRDELPLNNVHFSETKKPILLTCASPVGFQSVRITGNGEIHVLNSSQPIPSWFNFQPAKKQGEKKKKASSRAFQKGVAAGKIFAKRKIGQKKLLRLWRNVHPKNKTSPHTHTHTKKRITLLDK